MNPALTPVSRIREMTNTELVAFAKEHSHLTILEREFVKRIELYVAIDVRRATLSTDYRKESDPAVQRLVDWARSRR